MRQLFGLFWIGSVALAGVSYADDAVVPQSAPTLAEQGRLFERVRQAVAHSLPFLETGGVAWMQERQCISCHHVPFLLWTHRVAVSHGLKVDVDKLNKWDEWSRNDSLKHRNQFKLSKLELEQVNAEELPLSIREKLAPILDRPYESEAVFTDRLTSLLSEEELRAYRPHLLKMGELPLYASARNGGGLDVLAELIWMQRYHDSPQKVDFRDGLVGMMQQMQLANGTWTPGAQFLSMRQWPSETAIQVTTMWAAMSLDVDRQSSAEHSSFVKRAIEFVKHQAPDAKNCEWLATRLLFERQFGTAESLESTRKQLVSSQNSDGGWSWLIGGESDPYTTGLVLYALQQVESTDLANKIHSACEWILAAQRADGAWYTPSRKISNTTDPERLKARDEIYHYWGTAWCVLGLLNSLPVAGNSP